MHKIKHVTTLTVESVQEYSTENNDALDNIDALRKEMSYIDKQISKLVDLYSLDNMHSTL